MLKSPFLSRLLLSATILLSPLTIHSWASAAQFEQGEVNAQLFIAIARPYGDKKHDLLILQQIPGKRQCWQEQGSRPTTVTPLLLNFDFTGICDRSTDSNGYSIRIDGKDLGLEYLLSIVERQGDLWLIGTSRIDPSQPDILIGRTHGVKKGLLKIELEPGWRFTKRIFRGQVLSHVYLTGDRSALKSPAPRPNLAANNRSTSTDPNLDQPLSTQPVKELIFTADPSLPNNPNRPPLAPVLRSPRPLPSSPNNATLPPWPVPAANSRSTTPLTQSPLPPLSPRPNTSVNRRSLPPVPVPRSVSPQSSPTPLAAQSPPTSVSQGNRSSLPPLPPPPAVNNSIPSSLPNSGSGRSLSDVMTVSPRAATPPPSSINTHLSGWEQPPVPKPPRTKEPGGIDRFAIANQSSYRVLVNPGNQQDQLRSRYPDAFTTSYQGRSLLQIGRFSSQENAQKALNDLSNLGVQGIIVP